MRPVTLRFGELAIEGWSWAGDASWFRIHPPGLAFDCGRGALPMVGARDLFLTHGHLDHALGVPFVLSQRSLQGLGSTRVFCPRQTAPALSELISAAAHLEARSYRYQLAPMAPGDRVVVGPGLMVEAFATDHVVPSLGYHLLRQKRRLAAPYRGLPRTELVALRGQGVEIEEVLEELWLSYCGDTGPGVFDGEPRLFTSRVLMAECTFLRPERRARARRYGHLHLLDLAERADRFANQALVLYHLSRRHRAEDLERAVEEHLPSLAPRVHLLLGEG